MLRSCRFLLTLPVRAVLVLFIALFGIWACAFQPTNDQAWAWRIADTLDRWEAGLSVWAYGGKRTL